jgi:hypothetical protein
MMQQLSEGLIFTTPRPKGVMSCNDLVKRLQFLFSIDTHYASWGKREREREREREKRLSLEWRFTLQNTPHFVEANLDK